MFGSNGYVAVVTDEKIVANRKINVTHKVGNVKVKIKTTFIREVYISVHTPQNWGARRTEKFLKNNFPHNAVKRTLIASGVSA